MSKPILMPLPVIVEASLDHVCVDPEGDEDREEQGR
jgi:hypothetical protein